TSEGLTLNPHKTKFYQIDQFREHIREQLKDSRTFASLNATTLLGKLENELSKDMWNFGKIQTIFRALRHAPYQKSLDFFIENFDLVLPFSKDLVIYLDVLKRRCFVNTERLRQRVLDEIKGDVARSVPTIRVWLLELFVRGILPAPDEAGKLLEMEPNC